MVRRIAEWAYRQIGRFFPCDLTRVLVLPTAQLSKPATALDADVRALSTDDVNALRHDARHDLSAELVEDLREHSQMRCYAAFVDGVLAGYCLYCEGGGHVPARHNSGGQRFKGIGLQLPDATAYMFKAYVVPEHRGQGVFSVVLSRSIELLTTRGCHTVVTTSDWTNVASIQSMRKVGFQDRTLAGEVIIRGRHFFRIPPPLELPWAPETSTCQILMVEPS